MKDTNDVICSGRFTTLNGNPTVFTGNAVNMTAANAAAVGDVTFTVGELGAAAGGYDCQLVVHTAALYATWIDTSDTQKRIRLLDAAQNPAEGTVSVKMTRKVNA